MLSVGTPAPDFTLPDQHGEQVTLSSFRGTQTVVLIFYPGDQTPVCTTQLCGIRDSYDAFAEAGAIVLGINNGSESSHQRFAQKYTFQFPLLVDNDRKVAESYGAVLFSLGPLGGIINRTVYVINKDGTIAFAERGNPPTAKILAAIQA